MKVLYFSVTAGQGHNMCAKASMEYLEENGVECTMVDTFGYINPLLGESVARGYILATIYSREIYASAYYMACKRKPHKRISFNRITHKLLSSKLVSYVKNNKPDVIVCTHVFAAEMITELVKKGHYNGPTIGIMTDFTMHPYWEETKLDYYVLPNELLRNQFIKKGLPPDKILPFGIPIFKKFTSKMTKSEARKSLGIPDKPTIFLMAGGTGFGNLSKIIEKLDQLPLDFQMLAVCGSNKRLKSRLDKQKTEKNLFVHGFVNNVDVMMDASECLVSKPGGLTASEALAKQLMLIIPDAIPGQEERNLEFLLNNGLAMKVTPNFAVDECIYQFLCHPERASSANFMLEHVAKPNAAKDLGEFILGLKPAE